MPTKQKKLEIIQKEAFYLFQKKNQDYGNTFMKFGLIGILIRLHDKIERCLSLARSEAKIKSESLRDTLIDTSNYACMGIYLLEQKSTTIQEEIKEIHRKSLSIIEDIKLDNITGIFQKFNSELAKIISATNKKVIINTDDTTIRNFLFILHIQSALFAYEN